MLSVLIDNSVTKIINTEPPTCGENEVIVNMKMPLLYLALHYQ